MSAPGAGAILLVDMDSFFASIEQAHHPHLRGRPVIVCGDPTRRGVVTAASYEARPFGVRAGMPLGEARRLCPDAEYVEGNADKYVGVSLELLNLYLEYTPDVEPFSVDEAFVRPVRCPTLAEGEEVARAIQRRIDERFGLGASIGVGPNKLVAKMASGVRKPRGLTVFDEPGYCEHFWPLDIQELWGVGPKLAVRMRSLGILTVGELARAPIPILEGAFGVIGPELREAANGRDETPLVPYHQGIEAKSMGHEVTLPSNLSDRAALMAMLLRLCDQVARRMRSEGYVGRIVTLKLRDTAFRTRLRQRALGGHTDDHARIYSVATDLLGELWDGNPVRLIGVTMADLGRREGVVQADLFDSDRRARDLRAALDRVRDKLGEASLVPAGSLSRKRRLSHVPFGHLPHGRGHAP